jgi:NADH:ubiquinone reductase (H+-translocating)
MTLREDRPKVVIIGAGFGGLYAARWLENKPAEVLVIDRNNFHTFTPLLYQVASCGLEPEEIAYPVRGIFRDTPNLHFMLGEIVGIDPSAKTVSVKTNGHTRNESYDYLILAAGSITNYMNVDSAGQHGFGLKTLEEAVVLRNHILRLFERAAWTDDAQLREALTTLVVIGGGPTGLETAGALQELIQKVLRKEYDFLKTLQARVILVEAVDRLLVPFPEELQTAALEQARSLGIEVLLNTAVSDVGGGHITLKDGQTIPTHTLIWSAGVTASPLARMLGVELWRNGRVPVLQTLEVQDLHDVYVVGDMAYLENSKGQPYPMMIPAAKQQGILAAKNIMRREAGQPEQPFHYHDRGIMATIGRNRAVAFVYNRVALRGFPAWVAWLGLHLVALMGFRNRINVLTNWAWNYLTYDRSVRIILGHGQSEEMEAHTSLNVRNEVRDSEAFAESKGLRQ